MKKRSIIAVVVAFVLAIVFSVNAFAYEPAIRDVDITVRLDDDGTAYITQVWDVTVASGTEWYIVQGNLGDIVISEFSVKDENGRIFKNEGAWDVERSISQKEGKCGIVDKGDGDYELCWGVGSLGDHKFTVSYKMTNFVKRFSDADGFNHRFIASDLSSSPQHIKITIYKDGVAFSEENSRIWSFGFEGEKNFSQDGKIVAHSTGENIDYANVMVGFTPDLFSPTSVVTDKTFEDVIEVAFEDSDYDLEYIEGDNGGSGFESGGGFLMLLPLFSIVAFIIAISASKKSKSNSNNLQHSSGENSIDKKSIKNVNYSRDIPFEGNINVSYSVLKSLNMVKSQGAIISAYILKWLQKGKIEIKETPKKSFLGLSANKMQPSIVFNASSSDFEGVEKALYDMLVRASGGDKILQEKEFYNWSKSNYDKIDNWFDDVEFAGLQELKKVGDVEEVERKTFFNLIKYHKNEFTPKGKQRALEMFGFKKYLEDFTIINERNAVEVHLWDDYLVFASLFEIADKVSEEFKKLYPEYAFNQQSANQLDAFDVYLMMRMINTISYAGASGAKAGYSAAQMAQSSSGGGGFSSFGGGGGFSGGASGGGSR